MDETFHHLSGGGITLTNLFYEWPKEKLLNAADNYILEKLDTDKCRSYYLFGNKENNYFLPWMVRKYIPHPIVNNNSKSGRMNFTEKVSSNNIYIKKSTLTGRLVKRLMLNIATITGIYPLFCKRKVSNDFLQWIEEFKPDYIYTQLSDINSIRFIKELINKVNIPLVIHIMDDWPTTYSMPGILYYHWKKRIDIEFRELISRAEICLSISDGMSEEYKKRYKHTFIPFHNPIDKNIWLINSKNNYSINREDIRVLYSGRIGGLGVSNALSDVIKAIDELLDEGIHITLELQVPEKYHTLFSKYVKKGTVVFNSQVNYEEIPKIFSKADILILPYDFTSKGLKYIKYSMPTKASEYMISGTPILLYCREDVFLCKHAIKNGWAHVVTDKKLEVLKKEILYMIENENIRVKYSKNALNYALHHFESKKVRKEFFYTFT